MKYLGIDFGTIWTKAAVYDTDTGRGVLVNMEDSVAANTDFELYGGQYACPTAVFFDKANNVYYTGKKAVRSRNQDPENYHDKFKPFLSGPEAGRWVADVAYVLKNVHDRACQTAKVNSFNKVVLTIPSSTICNDYRWNAMMSAAHLAQIDYNGIEIIKEPEAAAYSIIKEKSTINNNDKFLVYDLGGGTFDPALLQFYNGTLRVIGERDSAIPRGKNIGGIYIDALINKDLVQMTPFFQEVVDLLMSMPMDEYGRPIRNETVSIRDYVAAMRDVDKLSQIPIDAKHQLSTGITEYHKQEFGLFDYHLSLDDYNEMIEPLIDDTIQCCDVLLADYGWEWKDIKKVFLVGGSSVIPLIKKKLVRKKTIEGAMFEIPSFDSYDYLYAVAKGAAMFEVLKPTPAQRLQFGLQCLNNKEYDEAEFQFTEGSQYYWLGLMEYEGLGRRKSYRKAFEIFSMLNNDPLCLFMVALMYFRGEGVKKNDTNALEYAKKFFGLGFNNKTVKDKASVLYNVLVGMASQTQIEMVYNSKFNLLWNIQR